MSIVWANLSYLYDAQHIELLEEIIRLDLMRKSSVRLDVNEQQGRFEVRLSNFNSLHWSRQFEWPWAIREGGLAKNDVVLEVGGGDAIFQYALAKRCRAVINVDTDVSVAGKLEELEINNSLLPHVESVCHDAAHLPYNAETFDKIFCISVIEHTEKPLEVMKELCRVLKVGGKLICTVDVGWDIDIQSMCEMLNLLGLQMPPRTENMLLNTDDGGKFIIEDGEITVLCFSFVKEAS